MHLSVKLTTDDVARLDRVRAYLSEVSVIPAAVSVSDAVRYALCMACQLIDEAAGEGRQDREEVS